MANDQKRLPPQKTSKAVFSGFTDTTGQKILIPVYGGEYRGKCPLESAEQVTAINYIRGRCPNVIHPRNEGKRHHNQTTKQKAEGLTKGASDIIIPGSPAFVCELKRKDKTKSRVEPEQVDYLAESIKLGAFCCIAYGHEAAIEAFKEWLELVNSCSNV